MGSECKEIQVKGLGLGQEEPQASTLNPKP